MTRAILLEQASKQAALLLRLNLLDDLDRLSDVLLGRKLVVEHQSHLALLVQDVRLPSGERSEEVALDAELLPDRVALVGQQREGQVVLLGKGLQMRTC